MADQDLIAQYLSRLAHDVRNSTSLITLNLDMLAGDALSDKAEECVADSREALRRLETLAKGLSHTLNPRLDPPIHLDLRATVEAVRAEVEGLRRAEVAPRPTQAFQLTGEATIEGAPEYFRVILKALLMNAFDATEALPARTVRVELVPEPLQIDVVNDGPPIDPTLPIFQPFVSARQHTRFRSGLGLTSARRLAERFGGRLELIRSDEEETRFRLTPNQPKW